MGAEYRKSEYVPHIATYIREKAPVGKFYLQSRTLQITILPWFVLFIDRVSLL